MEPIEINFSLVAGTAGTFAVTYSPLLKDWLVCRLGRRPSEHPNWIWVDSAPTEEDARKLAYAIYALSLAQEASQ